MVTAVACERTLRSSGDSDRDKKHSNHPPQPSPPPSATGMIVVTTTGTRAITFDCVFRGVRDSSRGGSSGSGCGNAGAETARAAR